METKTPVGGLRRLIFCAGVRAQGATDRKMRDAGLVDVLEVDSTLRVRLMYSTDDNFMGRDVYGDLERAYLLPHFIREAGARPAVAA